MTAYLSTCFFRLSNLACFFCFLGLRFSATMTRETRASVVSQPGRQTDSQGGEKRRGHVSEGSVTDGDGRR